MSLKDTTIKTAAKKKTPYKLADEKGLYLEVRPSGAKFWRYRYRINDKENTYSFGEYGLSPAGETQAQASARMAAGYYTLQEARQERIHARGLVKQGIHPGQEREKRHAIQVAESANTFEAVGLEWLEKNRPKWRDRNAKEIERMLKKDVFPHIGAIPVKQVTAASVLEIMDRVAKRGAPHVAISIRQWCSAIFAHAVRTLRADQDPTGVLKGHIVRPPVKHKKALSKDGIKELVEKIDGSAYITTRFALKLLLYMFVRPGELRAAEWAEFDLERAVWTIPGEKMKKGDKHLVPLSTQVVDLLNALKTVSGGRQYLFPNVRRPTGHLSDNAMNAALLRLGYKRQFTAHGFRATASTELHELGYRSDIIELQLAHVERNQTKASYNQAQYWNERKAMMQQWADLVDAWSRGDNEAEKVIPLRAKSAA